MPVFGGKTAGSSHTAKGLPCQDAFRFEITERREIIVAVADGLGSAKHSETGALKAVNSAVDKIKSIFEEGRLYDTPVAGMMKNRDIVKEAFYSARESLEEYSKETGLPIKALACTLIVVFTYEGFITTGHIGDGAVVAEKEGNITIISFPGESEYINEVTPLTAGKIDENIRINENIPGVEAFAVFSDGCQRAFLQRKEGEYTPYEPFFRPFFSYAKGLADEEKASKEIAGFLESKKMMENSDDDKTLVIAVMDRGDRDI